MTGSFNKSAANLLQGRIAPAPWNDRVTRPYGSQLTPQVATGVLHQADLGYMYQYADLLEEIRGTDTHLHSVLQKREMQVSSAEWELRPPDGSGKRAQSIADWCRDRLLEIEAQDDLGRSFEDAIAELMGGIYHGRSVLEAVWCQDGRYWYPEALEFVHPRRCAYTTDARLHLWDALGTNTTIWYTVPPLLEGLERVGGSASGPSTPFGTFPGLPINAFPQGKFIAHRPRVRGTYPWREGLGRLLLWYSIFKRFCIRDWLAYVEWAGRGLRIGQYMAGGVSDNPTRATPADEDALRSAIDNLSSSVSAVIPDTVKIEVHDAPRTNNTHDQLTTACNLEISKAVLGNTLTMEVGHTGGNRALGEVHQAAETLIGMSDARALASTIRRDLLTPMVRRTFGPNAPVPKIVFAVTPEEDMNDLAKRVASLVKDAGLQVPQKWLREVLGIPEPEADQATLQPSSPSPGGIALPTESAA